MDSTRKNRFGFTLIEMLIVIFIIGILMALLLPAVNAARESARATQCINNQQELGKALLQYDMTKKRLPGVLSRNIPTDPTSAPRNWVMSIFGDLGRMDLWEYWDRSVVNSGQLCDPISTPPLQPCVPIKVSQLICPSNSLVDPIGGLSYVANLGIFKLDSSGNPDFSVRLFCNRATWDPGYPSPTSPVQIEPDQSFTSVKTPTRTVMLSEKLQAGPWNYIPPNYISGTPPIPGDITYIPNILYLAFQWPDTPSTLKINDIPGPGLGSYHRGNIIVTFCDGHTEQIPRTTACWNDPENQVIGSP